MAQIRVRPARSNDAAAIAEIYNQGIRTRIATFETEERTAEERRAWLASRNARYPVLVATMVDDGKERVVGWASTSAYSSRACYAGVAEFSIYIHEAQRGKGVGIVLINRLIDAAEQAGFWKLLSRVFPENLASLALHKACGFRVVGIRERLGMMDGRWRDVVFMERRKP